MRLHVHGPLSTPSISRASRWAVFLLFVAAAAIVAPAGFSHAARTTVWAQSDDAIGQATIRRDEYGIPHITAPTEAAAAFAHGYAVAEDHLEELAPLFLRAQGRLASVFGESRVNDDTQILMLGIPQQARARFGDLPAAMQRILNAYAAGYNSVLKTAGSRAPAWAEPITGADVLAHCHAVYLLNFGRPPANFMSRTQPAPPTGSNFWGISRDKSATGKSLLLANPHLPWGGPYIFHEVQLTVPGTIDVAGASLIGFPVVTVGFNEHLGWAHTANVKFGSEQVYRLTIDPKDPQKYLVDGGSKPFTIDTQTLHIKTAAGDQTKTIETWRSHLGPVMRKDATYAWVFNTPSLDAINFLTQYNQMGKARSLQEFQTALAMQQLPVMSVGYVDRDGNIFYIENGRYPVRPSLGKGEKWLAGDRAENDPQGMLPQSVLPQLLNPKTGYLQNANNGFEFTTLKQSVDMSAFPAALRRQPELSLRAQNSLQALESRPRFALDDVTRAVFDNHVPLAARVKPQLLALIKNDPAATADVKAAAALVEEWNDRLAPDSAGAALFASWWADYDQEVDEGSHKVFARPWDRSDPLQTPSGIGEPAVATRAFASVVEKFKKAFGRIDVPWSQVYRIRRGSLELPAPGGTEDFGLLDTLEFKNDDAVKRSVNWGTSYLLTVEFAGAPVAYSLVPYSESADARSAHYTDQTSLFARSATKRLWTTESDVEKHTVRRYSPGK